MKSLSLDSPECGELRRRPAREQPAQGSRVLYNSRGIYFRHGSNRINNRTIYNYSQSSPSSPVHSKRLLSTRGGRMSSVELPDEPDKSLSSNSASPCPSPVKQPSKYQRLLPTNLYVILYNFKSRHADELDLKAGYKVTVIDTSDPDWWKGKCLGKIGYFPSKYCTKLQAGERPLQVTHNLQVSDGDNGLMLLRDQIVIQIPNFNVIKRRGSCSEQISACNEPKSIRSAPVTPCDSESSTWSREIYDSYRTENIYNEPEEGMWWWHRPLDVRRSHCRKCGASSATRPLKMLPCAGVAPEDYVPEDRRLLMSRDRPLLLVKELFP
ncbi:unnamed protein product [Parnassius apollo]|uniref:(apollo) hypothetical protein n=1 Tax=Parnassius apollo TaxID=110799 RepID=A0A8S3XTW2_PARAO|nr:unnamed protein product [Parnassius apollo]